MIYKLILTCCIAILICNYAQAQKSKPDLYFYFKNDSLKGIHKTNGKSEIRENMPSVANDIYHYNYIDVDKKKEYHYLLFSAINRNIFCVKDSNFFKSHKVLPYQNLEKIKGLISDEWGSKVSFNNVYIIEKIAINQFKIIQVQLYFPFDSEGVKIKNIN